MILRPLQSRLYSLSRANVSLISISHKFCSNNGSSTLAGCEKVSSHVGRLNGSRTFCSSQDLSIKKCVPCNAKDLKPMTEEAANVLIKQVPGWNLVSEGDTWKLHQSWKVKTFVKGMEFLKLVADVAEAEGHHPDLHLVGWNNVKIDIWTHAVDGVTENDFILASKINDLKIHHLLRITPPNK